MFLLETGVIVIGEIHIGNNAKIGIGAVVNKGVQDYCTVVGNPVKIICKRKWEMVEPLISVIVPVYKVEKYLNRCVESIVNQTYDNLEIILVDDGSPDNCPAICDLWANKDHRIQVIHKKNGGLSDARNAGLNVARGELISFIDSDDWIEQDFFQRLYYAISKNGADIAECATFYDTEDGKLIRVREEAPDFLLAHKEALHRLVLEDGVYQTVWNKLYRHEIINGIDFKVGKYNEDDFWTYKVLDKGKSLAIVEKPLYHYLQRSTSIIGVGYNVRRLDGLEARFQRMRYLQKYDELNTLVRQQFILDCMWHMQCVLLYLVKEDKKYAKAYILSLIQKMPKLKIKDMSVNKKYKIWLILFNCFPVFTAQIRNILKIGT